MQGYDVNERTFENLVGSLLNIFTGTTDSKASISVGWDIHKVHIRQTWTSWTFYVDRTQSVSRVSKPHVATLRNRVQRRLFPPMLFYVIMVPNDVLYHPSLYMNHTLYISRQSGIKITLKLFVKVFFDWTSTSLLRISQHKIFQRYTVPASFFKATYFKKIMIKRFNQLFYNWMKSVWILNVHILIIFYTLKLFSIHIL